MNRRILAWILFCHALSATVGWLGAQEETLGFLTTSVRTATDCDTTACTSSGEICVEPVAGTTSELHLCNPTTGFFGAAIGAAAPIAAEYFVNALHATLTGERKWTTNSTLTCTDGGANGNFTCAFNLANPNSWTGLQTFADLQVEAAGDVSIFFKDTDPVDPDVNVEFRVNCTGGGSGAEDCGLEIWQQRDGVLTKRLDFAEISDFLRILPPQQLALQNTDPGTNIEITFRDWADRIDDDANDGLIFVNLTDTTSGSEDARMGLGIVRGGGANPTTVLILDPDLGTRFVVTPPTFVDVDFEWEDGANTLTWTQPILTANRTVTWPSDPSGEVSLLGQTIADAEVDATGITTRTKLPGPIAYEDEVNTFTEFQTFGAIFLNSASSNAADPADAGVLRLSNTDQVCWEASPAGVDLCASAGGTNVMATTGFDRTGTQAGSCTFSAAVSCTVTLPVVEADANYLITAPGCSGSFDTWITGKTTAQFVINASTANSDTCDWRLIR